MWDSLFLITQPCKYGKQKCLLLSIVILFFSCADQSYLQTPAYSKQDLKKISWIEGNWKGMDGSTPFYEIYKIINDSTLETLSYDWNGKDSSQTSRSFLSWKDNAYYLGEKMNWKVTEISDSAIYMTPKSKKGNDILWKFGSPNNWDAILNSDKGEKLYHMERVNHFINTPAPH